jgi:hypothetical protein
MGGYNTNIMPNNEPETKLSKEFDRQVGNLIQKGYPKVAKVTAEEFTKHIKPVKDRVRELAPQVVEAKEGRIPFVISKAQEDTSACTRSTPQASSP